MGGAGAIEPRHAVAEVLPEVSGPSSAEVGRARDFNMCVENMGQECAKS